MRRLLPLRVARAVLWRLVHPTRMWIVRAGPDASVSAGADGYSFVRIGLHASIGDRTVAEHAMRTAGESAGLVEARLEHGDELVGWLSAGQMVSFCWITYRNRSVGPVRLTDAPGRAFLYNAFTSEQHRGRGLFTALLLCARAALGRDGVSELVGDVNVRNVPSARALKKAGFVPVGQLVFLTLLNRWQWPVGRTERLEPVGQIS